MIVSPRRGYVFVHAPKTGGTSLTLALEARAAADDVIVADTPKGRARRRRLAGATTAGRLWKHSTLADIRGLLPDAVLEALRPVTLVRNPWARVHSYHAWLRRQRFDHPAVRQAAAQDFEAFVLDHRTARAFRSSPYRSYVAGGRDPIYLRLERLTQDLPAFEALLGFRLEMPHANAGPAAGDWRDAYSDAMRGRVADFCAVDVAQFGYAFDGPA